MCVCVCVCVCIYIYICNEIYNAIMLRFKFGFIFRNYTITCETRKWSVTCLPLSQHTIASRTIPHSWNSFNSRE